MGILEKIAEIEREISRTQKNKGERGAVAVLTISHAMSQLVGSSVCVCACVSVSSVRVVLPIFQIQGVALTDTVRLMIITNTTIRQYSINIE